MTRTNADATAAAGSGAQRSAQTAKLEHRSDSTPRPQSKASAGALKASRATGLARQPLRDRERHRRALPRGAAPPRNEEARPALSERQIQRSIFEHLAWRGAPDAFVCHYPAGGFRRPAEAAILKSVGTLAGVPDIIAIHRGRVFALEIKTATGRVTDIQRTVHDRMRRAGAEVAVAYGLDEALAVLTGWKLLRGGPSR